MDQPNRAVPNRKTRRLQRIVNGIHEPSKSNNAVTEASTPIVTDALGSILNSGE